MKLYRILALLLVIPFTVSAFQIKAIKASGGEQSTIIEFSGSSAYCAGLNTDGQLAIDSFTDSLYLSQVLVDSNLVFENVGLFDAGWKHSIFVDTDGNCYTAGSNEHCMLGINSTNQYTKSRIPVRVHGGQQGGTYLEDIVQVSAGRSGTHCLAIEDGDSRVFAWGNNYYGQLAMGEDENNKSVPMLVRAGEQSGDPNAYFTDAVMVAAGTSHSVFLDSAGEVYCAGFNGSGELGNGVAFYRETTPVKVLAGAQSEVNTYLTNIVAVSAGWNHSMALEDLDPQDPDKRGRVFCWGSNEPGLTYTYGGKLGNGLSTGYSAEPLWVKSGTQGTEPNGLVDIVSISAGESHCLALDSKGFIYVWGDNVYGQLGQGTSGNQDNTYMPMKVKGGEMGTEFLCNIKEIDAGYWHSIAITNDGRMYTWGRGQKGELALGDTENRYYPCLVGNPSVTADVDISFSHTIENSNTALSPVIADSNDFTLTITVSNPPLNDPQYVGDIDSAILVLYLDAGCDYDWFTSWSPLVYDSAYNPTKRIYTWQIEDFDAGDTIVKTIDLTANLSAYPGGSLAFKAVFETDFAFTQASHAVPVADWYEINNGIIYVDSKAANRDGKGTSWENPFVRFEDALTRAAMDPNSYNEIWVAEGLYYPPVKSSFTIPVGVSIYGGFEGVSTETAREHRDYTRNTCRLAGYGSDYVVKFENYTPTTSTSILDGFTITGGKIAGIYCDDSTPQISHCVIAGNGVEDYQYAYGIEISQADTEIEDCIIANNSGAGILSWGDKTLSVNRTMVKDNGGGIHAGYLNLSNSIVSGNSGTGVYIYYGYTAQITGCTVISNVDYGISGSSTPVRNTIIWNNNSGGVQQSGCTLTNCYENDPLFLFTAAAYQDYICIPLYNSPCVDGGNNNFVPQDDKDFYNQDRINNGTVDIGAVEYPGILDNIIFDLNKDAIINYSDFAYLADTWLLDSGQGGYNADCDWNSDDTIDEQDLCEFAESWLWQPQLLQSGELSGLAKWQVAYSPFQSLDITIPTMGLMMSMSMEESFVETAPDVPILAPEKQSINPAPAPTQQQQTETAARTIIFLDNLRSSGQITGLSEQQWQQFREGLISTMISQ